MRKFNKKGQNTAEYAILIALVVAAAVAMQVYVKRGMQGGIKFVVDKVKKSDSGTGQYEPYYLESDYDSTQYGYTDVEETKEGGEVIRRFGAAEDGTTVGEDTAHKTTRTGYQEEKGVDTFDRN